MTTCLTCTNWKPRENPAMARQGYAMCGLGKRYTFLAPWWTCEKHQAASAEIVEKRAGMAIEPATETKPKKGKRP